MAAALYVTLTNLKARLGISDATDDALLARIATATNEYVESITGRSIASNTLTAVTLDGYDAVEDGRVLPIPQGIRTVSLLRVAPHTGGSWSTVASGDYFLRPDAQHRQPGWPANEIVISDIPSASTTYPYFPQGYANVEVTGTGGWDPMPEDLREVAEVIAVRAWQARQSGQSDMSGSDDTGQPTVSRYVSGRDRETIMRYRWRSVAII